MRKKLDHLVESIRQRIGFFLPPLIHYPLLTGSLCYILGNCLAVISGVLPTVMGVLLVLVLVVFIFYKHLNKIVLYKLLLALFFILLGILKVQYFQYQLIRSHITKMYDQEVSVIGVVAEEIEQIGTKQRMVIDVLYVYLGGSKVNFSKGNYKLLTKTYYHPIAYGDTVKIQGVIREPFEEKSFSYKEYLYAQSIFAILEGERVEVIDHHGKCAILIELKRLKGNLSSQIERILPQPHASLVSGIVFGTKHSMSDQFQNQLKKTGTTHIIAVSGYNINVLISVLGIGTLICGRKILNFFSIIFIILFMFFVGIDNIPVVRASSMGILLIISQLIGKKSCHVILLSCLIAILLWVHPLCFKLVSFQLSFASTVGLIVFGDILKQRIAWLPEYTQEDVAATLAAMISTLPITLSQFGQISLIAPLTNFFVLPVIPFITIFGLGVIIFGGICIPLAQIAAYILWLPLSYIIWIISTFSTVKFSFITVNGLLSRSISATLIIFIVTIGLEVVYQNGQNEH